VIKGLQQYWSPEIIVIRWKQLHPGESLSPGTIYRAVRKGQLPAIHAKTHLRRRGKRRKPRTQSIKPEHTIHDRPKEIESRARLGDLEGDTVYGAIGKGCLVTFVDRRSRKLYAIRADNREKEHIAGKTQEALADAEVNTITLDNGSEFAAFKNIEQALDATIYFADPRSPWQRGSNENTNGLIRFFFPKGTNFKAVDDEAVQQVVALINNRPRKCLGWLSSNEFLERCT
jgi:IS30 family transposase